MPTKETKYWGQFDKDLLAKLIHRQLIDITNTSLWNIEQVRLAHFWHRDPLNFRHNFCSYSATFDLEIEYSGAQWSKGGVKLRHLYLLVLPSIYASSNTLSPPPHRPLCLEEEVDNGKVGDMDNNAADAAATANNGNEDMPPKAKPAATKEAAALTKLAAAAAT